jgi:hypothetical protein
MPYILSKNSDLFWLSGIVQKAAVILFPDNLIKISRGTGTHCPNELKEKWDGRRLRVQRSIGGIKLLYGWTVSMLCFKPDTFIRHHLFRYKRERP